MTRPQPPIKNTPIGDAPQPVGPQITVDGVIDPASGEGFVRITVNSVLTSLAFAIPMGQAEPFVGELKRNVIDVVGSLKAEQKSKLIVPSNGLLIPGKS